MKKRLKKLIKYLEENLDWTVYDDKMNCSKCDNFEYGKDKKFCPECGSKLKRVRSNEEVEEDLMEALYHAGFK